MNLFTDTFSTPLGAFSVAVHESGAVAATAFGDRETLQRRLSVSHPRNGSFGRQVKCHLIDDTVVTQPVRTQVLEYFTGRRRDFTVTLAAVGTGFQHEVWRALRAIPFGETRSYGQLAARLGRPSAARAIGRANATNPICLVVPCHRVIGADGSLTGFAFGEAIKRALLEHEGNDAIRAA